MKKLCTQLSFTFPIFGLLACAGNQVTSNGQSDNSVEWEPYDKNVQPWWAKPYAFTSEKVDGVLIPEQRTNPGWSGTNHDPLKMTVYSVKVNFEPRWREYADTADLHSRRWFQGLEQN